MNLTRETVPPVIVRPPDPRVQDPEALAEIELYGNLVIAATSSGRALTPEEIDAALGLAPS